MNSTAQFLKRRNDALEVTVYELGVLLGTLSCVSCAFAFTAGQLGVETALVEWHEAVAALPRQAA